MNNGSKNLETRLKEIAGRIRELRKSKVLPQSRWRRRASPSTAPACRRGSPA